MVFKLLLLFIPVSLALSYFEFSPLWIFASAAAAIIPLAEWIRRATEQIAHHSGSVIGGLLNITFGNSAEMILALFVLLEGNVTVVKATITGSIIGNSLFGLGLAIVVGSFGRSVQRFSRERAGLLSSLLILSVIGLLVPALFDYTERGIASASDAARLDENLSLGVAVVLIAAYAGNLIYTLITHRDVFATEETGQTEKSNRKKEKPENAEQEAKNKNEAAQKGETEKKNESERKSEEAKKGETAEWSFWTAMGILVAATVGVALEAELVSGALEDTAKQLGLTTFFLGIIVLPLVGNAAEYFSVVYFARKNQMGLVMSIAVGASIQIALLTAPLLVLISYAFGKPMNLVFSNPLELIAIAGVAFAVNSIAQDGETTWFEGLLLLAVYALLGLAFFFVTV